MRTGRCFQPAFSWFHEASDSFSSVSIEERDAEGPPAAPPPPPEPPPGPGESLPVKAALGGD
jgi:hypothetical protein